MPPTLRRIRAIALLLAASLAGGCISTPTQTDPLAGLAPDDAAAYKKLSAVLVYSANTRAASDYLRKTLGSYDPGPRLLLETGEFLQKSFKTVTRADALEDAVGSDADIVVVLDANVQDATFFTQKTTIFSDLGLVFLSPDGKEIERLRARHETSEFAHLTQNQPVIDTWKESLNDLGAAMYASDKLKEYAKSRSSRARGSVAALDKNDILGMMKQAMKEAGNSTPAAADAAPTAVSDVDKPRYRAASRPDDYAVVVGIEKYSGDLPEAQYAERDALSVKNHLLALGFEARNVAYLSGSGASAGALKKNLESWLPNHVTEDSTVVFYYSGHGSPDPTTGEAYLVPWDGDPQYLKDTAYPMKRLYERLGALKARRVLVVLDSCFSGQKGRSVLAPGTRPLVSKIDLGAAADARIVSLTASDGDQISGTLPEQSHGAFTYYLLKGLNGAAADASGAVTVRGLYDYLAPKVQNAARGQNREQTPQLLSREDQAAWHLRD
jgi:hypothetical protein